MPGLMVHAAKNTHISTEYAKLATCEKLSIIKYKTEDNAKTDAACSQKYAQLSQAKREKLIRNTLVVHRLRH